MRRFTSCAVLLTAAIPLVAFCPAVSAQESGPASRIADFIDPQTVAVLRVDLERLEAADIQNVVGDLPVDQLGQTTLAESVQAVRRLGAPEFFLVASLADVPRSGLFAVLPGARSPRADGNTPDVLAALGECEQIGDALVCGQRVTLNRLKNQQAQDRSIPAAAFEAVAGFPVQLVIAPSDDHRRVLREMGPSLPPELGGLNGRTLANGALWAAMGVKLAPETNLRLVVQSQDAAAAAALRDSIQAALQTFARNPVLRELVRDTENVVRRLTPHIDGDRLVLELSHENPVLQATITQIQRAAGQVREASARSQSSNKLKQFGLAMHNFHDLYSSFPPYTSYDANGKPLLSWRVYLLPYLDAGELYGEFHLDEPWDSEHNKRLIAKMPVVFASPHAAAAAREGMTTYLAPIHEKAAFAGEREGVPIRSLTDGASNTILLLEVPADEAVIWTKPDDWEVDLDDPLKGLFPEGREGLFLLLADGAARFILRTIDPKTLKALFTRNGGEVVGEF